MPATLIPPPRTPSGHGPGRGGGPWGRGDGPHGSPEWQPSSLSLQQLGMVLGLVSVAMLFGALVVAYGLRLQLQPEAARVPLPWLVWPGTALLLGSSLALERARQALRHGIVLVYTRRLRLTLALGVGFLALQLVSWGLLASHGVLLRANPRGSVFYAFTAVHGAHLSGGVLYLAWLYSRMRRLAFATDADLHRHRVASGTAALYWHSMGVLWLILLALLWNWSR